MQKKIFIRICRLFSISDDNELSENHERYATQYFLGFVASIALINAGIQLTWFGPAFPILQSEELSPIGVVTNAQASWINSLLQFGALFGSIFGSYLANNIGRKYTIIISIIPTSISDILIIFVQNVYMLYAARIFAGFSVGIIFVGVPTYITEISSPKIRGILGTFLTIFMTFSWIIQHFLQPIMSLQLNRIIILTISFVICCAAAYFLPETPHYYIMKDKEKLAKKSLQKLRQRMNVENELNEIKESKMMEEHNKLSLCEYLQTKTIRKCISIIFIPVIAQQFSGALIVLGYVPTIFNESVPTISTYYGSIILIVCFVLGTLLSTFFIDNFGRRFLFISSGIMISIITTLIGLYYVFESIYGIDIVSKYSVILFILFICYFVIFAFGILSLVSIYVGELFETHFRATAALISSAGNSLCGFIVVQVYGIIYRNFELQYIFFFFTICSILFTIFGYCFLPETKGKSLQEIHKDLML